MQWPRWWAHDHGCPPLSWTGWYSDPFQWPWAKWRGFTATAAATSVIAVTEMTAGKEVKATSTVFGIQIAEATGLASGAGGRERSNFAGIVGVGLGGLIMALMMV